MRCPFCGANKDKVVDSRESKDGDTIRRRRECLDCERRFTSYEQIEQIAFRVVKRDGTREDFNRPKYLAGLLKACEKRPVSLRQLEDIVSEAENLVQESDDREIATADLGNFAMEKLRGLDQVAYVRFASVYRKFEDVESFMDELRELIAQRT